MSVNNETYHLPIEWQFNLILNTKMTKRWIRINENNVYICLIINYYYKKQMKKLTFLIAGLVVLSACKKDYTCECTYSETESYQGTSETYIENYSVTYPKATKKMVANQDECLSTERTYTSTEYVGSDINGAIYADVTRKEVQDCSITK